MTRSLKSKLSFIGFWIFLALFIQWQAPLRIRNVHFDALWSPPAKTHLKLLLLGDTGLPGPELEQLRQTLLGEEKDLIVALGDLIYPYGPICSQGVLTEGAREMYQERLGDFYKDLGAMTLMVIGNHEVRGQQRDEAREACFLGFAALTPNLYLPALTYQVDLGGAIVAVINTNDLTSEDGVATRAAFDAHSGWKLLFGHHVLRTYHDKERQDFVRPWVKEHGLRPDLYANGHAHLLQFGIFDGIPALTSGATSKLRDRPSCPPDCGPGQRWGRSVRGYAMLELTPQKMHLIVKDIMGNKLWEWEQTAPPDK